jgi:SAM-dependent methyltransferase
MGDVPRFSPLGQCWVCGGDRLVRVHEAIFDHSAFRDQDPELAAYTGQRVALMRCARCGFGQPAALPGLPQYFARMYDQRWSGDWMAQEFASDYKDLIFRTVLGALARRLPPGRRTLLDVGAHVGRLIRLALAEGWDAEGIELNPQTSAFARRATGRPVHQLDAHDLAERGRRFDAATLIDVLEHIPDPVPVVAGIARVLAPGGWVAVKVPHGPAQLRKEVLRARLVRGYRATVADNLVHVNHFTPRSLRLALERAGFTDVRVTVAAPELVPHGHGGTLRRLLMNGARRSFYTTTRALPGGVHTPLALHLQAYARIP